MIEKMSTEQHLQPPAAFSKFDVAQQEAFVNSIKDFEHDIEILDYRLSSSEAVGAELAVLLAAFSKAQAEHHATLNQLAATTQQLAIIENSTMWRICGALRSRLMRYPRLRLILRRLLKLLYWAATGQLRSRFHQYLASRNKGGGASHVQFSGKIPTKAEADAWNSAWYGARQLSLERRRTAVSLDAATITNADVHYGEATAHIASRYIAPYSRDDVSALRRIAPSKFIRGVFESAQPSATEQQGKMCYAIVTPFYGHIDFFRLCARSVRELMNADVAAGHGERTEWIVLNDDPRFSVTQLQEILSAEGLSRNIRLISDGKNVGISSRLNEACTAATSDWILFLDCDDEIEATTLEVLDYYIKDFPRCRYISSGVCDIDENGSVLRWRKHREPTRIFEAGMTVGHLKAIRKDLIDEVGPFAVEHSGCQDYDFALRVSLREPILCIPEYLYRYRWHSNSQSVGNTIAQAAKTLHVLRDFMRRLADHLTVSQSVPCPVGSLSNLPRIGACLIRTQGSRLDLLAETVASVLEQAVKIVPCVIVHGNEGQLTLVKDWLLLRKLEAVVLHAPDLTKRRGYPLNVGLNFLRQHVDTYDYFFFLDDDDILYPFYGQRMTELLYLTGCDVGVAEAASRVPWHSTRKENTLKPIGALVAGNFIPIHCFVITMSFLARNDLKFSEDVNYLEDWSFLIDLYANGACFHVLPEVLCEYRIIGDGNRVIKSDPAHYEVCSEAVNAKARAAVAELGVQRFLYDFFNFDPTEQSELTPPEIGQLIDANYMFEMASAKVAK